MIPPNRADDVGEIVRFAQTTGFPVPMRATRWYFCEAITRAYLAKRHEFARLVAEKHVYEVGELPLGWEPHTESGFTFYLREPLKTKADLRTHVQCAIAGLHSTFASTSIITDEAAAMAFVQRELRNIKRAFHFLGLPRPNSDTWQLSTLWDYEEAFYKLIDAIPADPPSHQPIAVDLNLSTDVQAIESSSELPDMDRSVICGDTEKDAILVMGETKWLRGKTFDVIKSLHDAFPQGRSLPSLEEVCGDPAKMIRNLRQKDLNWKAVISAPGDDDRKEAAKAAKKRDEAGYLLKSASAVLAASECVSEQDSEHQLGNDSEYCLDTARSTTPQVPAS